MGTGLEVAEGGPVNQLLYVNLVKRVILPLNDLVEWDRYGLRDDGGFAFGWIKRDDGFYDFVSVTFQLTGNAFAISYTTSSKKHSKEIAGRFNLGGTAVYDYLECKPASDIPEANLVKWQKGEKFVLCLFLIGIVALRFFSPIFVDIFTSNLGYDTSFAGLKKPPSRANFLPLGETGQFYKLSNGGQTQAGGNRVSEPIAMAVRA